MGFRFGEGLVWGVGLAVSGIGFGVSFRVQTHS